MEAESVVLNLNVITALKTAMSIVDDMVADVGVKNQIVNMVPMEKQIIVDDMVAEFGVKSQIVNQVLLAKQIIVDDMVGESVAMN